MPALRRDAALAEQALEAVQAILRVRAREEVRASLADCLDGIDPARTASILSDATDAVLAGALTVATGLVAGTHWRATTAFATGPHANLAEAAELLLDQGATRLVIAPWFLTHGTITDRVAKFAAAQRIPMAQPLGAHRLVAETVLDRFDEVAAVPRAA